MEGMTTKRQSQESRFDWEAVETGKIAGQKYWILKGMLWKQEDERNAKLERRYPADIRRILKEQADSCGYNGYIKFDKRPVRERGYNGIMAYVPVHGGITYAHEERDGSITYGFDTAHIGQEKIPVRDLKWIRKEIRNMRAGILRAKKVEAKYMRCVSKKGKAKYAAHVYTLKRPAGKLGFSAMINLLTGEI